MKKMYHLVNDYNDHNEFTTDEEKIRKIYIDECLQCVDNNISENSSKEEVKSARDWLYEGMTSLYNYDTEYFIKKLNSDHNWLIEVYIKEEK